MCDVRKHVDIAHTNIEIESTVLRDNSEVETIEFELEVELEPEVEIELEVEDIDEVEEEEEDESTDFVVPGPADHMAQLFVIRDNSNLFTVEDKDYARLKGDPLISQGLSIIDDDLDPLTMIWTESSLSSFPNV